MSFIFRPHDRLFKVLMENLDVARDFLQAHLPKALTEQCRWSTLRLESGTFISPKLREHMSDMLYSVQGEKSDIGIYILIEHQSSPDELMPFRVLEYRLAAMRRYIEQNQGKKLPIVVPLLFYNGLQSPYPYSMKLMDCFQDAELARQFFPEPISLVDLTVIPDEELFSHQHAAALEIVMKHARTRDIYLVLQDILKSLLDYPLPVDKGINILQYLMQEGNCQDNEKFFSYVIVHAPEYGEGIMTLAQELKQEGKREGIQEGGLAIMRSSVLNMLKNGLDPAQIIKFTGFDENEVIKIVENKDKNIKN